MSDLEDLVARWAVGWMACRGSQAEVLADGVVETFPRAPTRERELIAVRPADPDALVAGLGPTDWLTVVPPLREAPGGMVSLTEDETLMSAPLSAGPADPVVILQPHGRTCSALLQISGVQVASGVVAVVGTDAIFDRIETAPDYRRRGFGSLVMAALTSYAVDAGADRGLLAATPEGRALYERLGWSVVERLMTYARPV